MSKQYPINKVTLKYKKNYIVKQKINFHIYENSTSEKEGSIIPWIEIFKHKQPKYNQGMKMFYLRIDLLVYQKNWKIMNY